MTRARFPQSAAVHLIRCWQGQSSISALPICATLSPCAAGATRGAVSAQDDLLGLRARIVVHGSYFDSTTFQKAHRRGAPAFGEMVMNTRDIEDIEDGTVNGVRYTNPSRFSRLRGAW